jgi:hypothetical protein
MLKNSFISNVILQSFLSYLAYSQTFPIIPFLDSTQFSSTISIPNLLGSLPSNNPKSSFAINVHLQILSPLYLKSYHQGNNVQLYSLSDTERRKIFAPGSYHS